MHNKLITYNYSDCRKTKAHACVAVVRSNDRTREVSTRTVISYAFYNCLGAVCRHVTVTVTVLSLVTFSELSAIFTFDDKKMMADKACGRFY